MQNDDIKELRSKLDIVEVISSYIPLNKKGHNYMGLCPFHNDHSPSLSVSREKQIYKCFVCGESGNVFSFVMNYEHVSFYDALRTLSEKFGININLNIKKEENKNSKFYEIMDLANKFFQNNLNSKEGLEARKYLEKRMLSSDIIKEFGIGLALNKHDLLTSLLLNKGHSLEELNSIDLSNTNHDSYINRIMFPLCDKEGRVIGFSGRIYDNSNYNKYQNSKETILFKKREVLFNYHRAKEEIRKNKYVIVMEGFMAVIRSFSVGIKNCIATMGTALSQEQANLIKRLNNNVYLCYDGDNAGRTATLTSGEIFQKLGCNVNVIILSNGLDPDDYILKYGADSFKELINNAVSFLDFKIRSLKVNTNINDIEEKAEYVNKVLLEIKKENDEIKREIMLKRLASDTDIWYNTLEKKLFELIEEEKNSIPKEELVVVKKPDGKLRVMESLVYYMLNYSPAITLFDDSNVYIPDKDIRTIINEIVSYYNRYGEISEADFYTYVEDKKDLVVILKRILAKDYPSSITSDLVKDSLKAINNYNVALEIKKIEKMIKEEVNIDEQIRLMNKIQTLKMKEG